MFVRLAVCGGNRIGRRARDVSMEIAVAAQRESQARRGPVGRGHGQWPLRDYRCGLRSDEDAVDVGRNRVAPNGRAVP